VIVGVPVKLLGILPTVAYNLILPTLFGLTATGASVWVGIYYMVKPKLAVDEKKANLRALFSGLLASVSVLILGNLGTLRMIWQGAQKLVAPGGVIDYCRRFFNAGDGSSLACFNSYKVRGCLIVLAIGTGYPPGRYQVKQSRNFLSLHSLMRPACTLDCVTHNIVGNRLGFISLARKMALG